MAKANKPNAGWLKAARKGDKSSMSALADWYEERGEYLIAARWREKAGLSRLKYKVYNTVTGKIVKEYNTQGGATAEVNSFEKEQDRANHVIKVIEYMPREVATMRAKKIPKRYWRGNVTIKTGDLTGQRGVVIGADYIRHHSEYRRQGFDFIYTVQVGSSQIQFYVDQVEFDC